MKTHQRRQRRPVSYCQVAPAPYCQIYTSSSPAARCRAKTPARVLTRAGVLALAGAAGSGLAERDRRVLGLRAGGRARAPAIRDIYIRDPRYAGHKFGAR